MSLLVTALAVTGCSKPAQDDAPAAEVAAQMSYPMTKTVEQFDNYHGTDVADPYRWLEDMDNQEVKDWVAEQNTLSRPYLEKLPTREAYKNRITELWDYEKYSVPYYIEGRYFYSHNNGLQNQYVLYTKTSLEGEAEVLIDPNTFSEDGTVSLAGYEVSPKANLIAYQKSDGGSDWNTIHVRNVGDKSDLTDTLAGVKFTGVSWLPDETGFFYSRYPKNEAGEWDDSQPVAIYFHKLGDDQTQDKRIFGFVDKPEWNPYPVVINDGKDILISVFHGYEANAIYRLSLDDNAELQPVFADWDGNYGYVDQVDDTLYFTSTENAATGKLISFDLASNKVTEVVAARAETLDGVSLLGGKLFLQYLKDVQSVIEIHGLDGKHESTLPIDEIGTISGFYGDEDSPVTFYRISSFTNPGTLYKYDLKTGESELYQSVDVPVDFSQFVTEQVFYPSKDGTKIPMFLVHKKDIKLDGNNKTLLYGYGGFNVSLTPGYSVTRMAWIEKGHVLAIPNLRGGGEYGQEWHLAGTKLQKQNVFDDFIAAAEYLIANKYTRPEKLAIQGGSNGGLLVGATLTQRPDLFAAALPAVGVLDMMRYHTASANARGWSSDYGLSENPDEFAALLAYSPVHNTKPGTCYPATLVTTGDHDDRVVPWHSYKFAAALQHDQGCDKPVLLRVETRAGHGAGTPTWMRIEGYADLWAFIDDATE